MQLHYNGHRCFVVNTRVLSMGNSVVSPNIYTQLLNEFQVAFQKDLAELIDLYLIDARKKFSNLLSALETKNLENFTGAARELRRRSMDVGAIPFSHCCLALEISTQEMRLEHLKKIVFQLENQFNDVEQELLQIKAAHSAKVKKLF